MLSYDHVKNAEKDINDAIRTLEAKYGVSDVKIFENSCVIIYNDQIDEDLQENLHRYVTVREALDDKPGVPEEFKNISMADIVKEFISYVKENFSGFDFHSYQLNHKIRIFLEKKGVRTFNTEGQIFESKFIHEVELIIEKQDKEMLPKLEKDIFEWCKKNNMLKITKAEVSAYLTERSMSMNTDIKNMIYVHVNNMLKS